MDDCDTWQEHESTGLQCFHFGFKILFQLKILLLQCFILSRSYRQCSVHLKLFFLKYWLQIPSKFRYQPKSLFVICVVRSCDWSSWTVGDRCSTLPLPVGCTEKALFNIDLPRNVSSLLMCGQRDRDKVCLLGHCLPHLKASCIFSSCIH